jgi:hypothetical protein
MEGFREEGTELTASACAGVEPVEAKDVAPDTAGCVVCLRQKQPLELIPVALALSAIIRSLRDVPRL